jgi:hypothetical protein
MNVKTIDVFNRANCCLRRWFDEPRPDRPNRSNCVSHDAACIHAKRAHNEARTIIGSAFASSQHKPSASDDQHIRRSMLKQMLALNCREKPRQGFESGPKAQGQGSHGYHSPKNNPDGEKAASDLRDSDRFRQPPQAKAIGQENLPQTGRTFNSCVFLATNRQLSSFSFTGCWQNSDISSPDASRPAAGELRQVDKQPLSASERRPGGDTWRGD